MLGRGIKNVVVVDRNELRLSKAALLGVKTINTSTENLKDKLIEIFGTYPSYDPIPDVDMYVDAAGAPPSVSYTHLRILSVESHINHKMSSQHYLEKQ